MDELIQYQTAVDIYLDTQIDLTGAEVKIKMKKPDGSVVDDLAATVQDDKRTILHKFLPTNRYDVGVYRLWPFVTFADGRTAAGRAIKIQFLAEGS